MGQWAVSPPPGVIRTLLGSCLGVVLYDRLEKFGGVAHVVLPDSRGATDQPGKFADTAVPGLVKDLERLAGRPIRPRLTAKIFGGASMFQTTGNGMDIGRQNQEAVEKALTSLGISVVARDLGGTAGRRLTFFTATGVVSVKVPGGADYDL